MVTVQQMQVGKLMDRRASVDVRTNPAAEPGTPKASFAELFYDLFFVASLTSFGIKHEITTDQAIASYVAFFTILWYCPA
jgi:low temperature requirement protein LtrA